MEKVPEAGYKILGLKISGLQRKLTLKNLSFPLKVLGALSRASQIVQEFRPQAVVGVGGYASGPLVFAATRRGVPALLQEQNSYAGLTNKILARYVRKICVAYPRLEQYFPVQKLVFTGNPVRQDIADLESKRAEGRQHFGLRADSPTLLVLGGSLGARTLNNCLEQGFDKLRQQGIQVIWQCGKAYYPQLEERLRGQLPPEIKLMPFIREMPLAYAAADLVISRAGALSISELCLAAKPSILVPSPNVAEDHQTKNAQALVSQQAALLVSDGQAPEKLIDKAIELANDSQLQKSLQENVRKLAKPEAARHIAQEVLSLIH